MCDVVALDNVTPLSWVVKKRSLVTTGLQEEDVIAKEMEQQIEEDCSSGDVAAMRNEGMLEQQVLV